MTNGGRRTLPKVSVLIPCFNAERWLAEAVESALMQSWPAVQVVVVDDGSTDGSVEVARSYESHGVRLLTQNRRGAGAARNRALATATGDFIQYLDADDLLSQDKIEEQMRVLQRSRPRMLAVSATIHFRDGGDPQGGIAHNGWPMVDAADPVEWLIRLWGGDGVGGMVHPGAWLTPRAVAEAAGPWDELPSPDDDGEYFARVVLASAGIRRSAAGYSYYRKHPSGECLSGASSLQYQEGALRSLDYKARHLLGRTSSTRARRALARQYEARAVLAYPDFPGLSEHALDRARELGGRGDFPRFGSYLGRLVSASLGWKAARRLQRVAHAIRRPRIHHDRA